MSNIDVEEFLDKDDYNYDIKETPNARPTEYQRALEGSPDTGNSSGTQGGIHSAGSPRISGTVRERILAKCPFVTWGNEDRFWHLLSLLQLQGK